MGRILAKIKNTSSLFCIIIKDNYFNKGIRLFSRFFAKKTPNCEMNKKTPHKGIGGVFVYKHISKHILKRSNFKTVAV